MTWHAPNLPADKHCFFDSFGGISEGLYKGLNVNTKSDDSTSNLDTNLEIVAQYFNLHKTNMHLLRQDVSSDVCYVSSPSQDQIFADGAVTNQPNTILCIRTADCAPILLADYEHGIIGASHAGWRGAYKGIIENTIDLMLQKGANVSNIAAAIGPCIAQPSYEVDNSFYQTINQPKYFIPGQKDHWLFNLEEYCIDKLKKCGISNISTSSIDTYPSTNGYYSYRRLSHQNLINKPNCFPTEMSAIVL